MVAHNKKKFSVFCRLIIFLYFFFLRGQSLLLKVNSGAYSVTKVDHKHYRMCKLAKLTILVRIEWVWFEPSGWGILKVMNLTLNIKPKIPQTISTAATIEE